MKRMWRVEAEGGAPVGPSVEAVSPWEAAHIFAERSCRPDDGLFVVLVRPEVDGEPIEEAIPDRFQVEGKTYIQWEVDGLPTQRDVGEWSPVERNGVGAVYLLRNRENRVMAIVGGDSTVATIFDEQGVSRSVALTVEEHGIDLDDPSMQAERRWCEAVLRDGLLGER